MWRWLLAALGLLAALLLISRLRPAAEVDSAQASSEVEGRPGDPVLAEPELVDEVTTRQVVEREATPSFPAQDTSASAIVRVEWEDTGEPLVGADVVVKGEEGEGYQQGTTDGAGEWHVSGLLSGATLFMTIRGVRKSEEFSTGEPHRVTLRIPDGVDVRGTVVDSTGVAVPRARVMVMTNGTWPRLETTADHAGRFFVRDLVSRGETVEGSQLFAMAEGFTRSRVHMVWGDPGDTLEVELGLTAGAGDLEVIVIGPSGGRASGYGWDLQDSTPAFKRRGDGSTLWKAPLFPEPYEGEVGFMRFVGLAPGRARIEIWPDDLPGRTVEAEIVAGQTTSVTVDFSEPMEEQPAPPAGPPLGGRVLDADDAPVEQWEVVPRDRNGNTFHAYAVITDAEGRFLLDTTPIGPFSLAVYPSNLPLPEPVLEEAGFVPGDLDLVLRLPVGLPATGHALARIRGPGGESADDPAAWITRDDEEDWSGLPPAHASGEVLIELLPGRYRLLCSASNAAFRETEPFEIVAGRTNDIGDIELDAGGWIEARFVFPPGAAEPLLRSAGVWHAEKGLVSPLTFEDELGISGHLPEGSYLVRVLHERWFGIAEVEIQSGEMTSAEVFLEPAIERTLLLTLPRDAGLTGPHWVTLRDDAGRKFFLDSGWVTDGRIEILVPGLQPGTYSVELEKRWRGTLSIDTFEAADVLSVELK